MGLRTPVSAILCPALAGRVSFMNNQPYAQEKKAVAMPEINLSEMFKRDENRIVFTGRKGLNEDPQAFEPEQ